MIAELLYHTTLTVVDLQGDSSGGAQTVYVLGTHGTLEAAKKFAANALHGLGYEPEDFAVFEGHDPSRHWRHGDGVVVYARAHNSTELLVGLMTTPNSQGIAARENGTLELAPGSHLHYVLQKTVDYNRDRSGAVQTTEIEGCFVRREEAVKAAKECLLQAVGPRGEFAQYDERPNLGPQEDWPFGEDVLVHAIANTGENYSVAVRTPPDAHKQHGKHTMKHHKSPQEHKLAMEHTKAGVAST